MVSLPTSSSSVMSIPSTTSSYRRRREPVWGIPERCHCGNYPVLKTSRTMQNPGRRFYGCDDGEDGGSHLFKWWDEAMMEEFQSLRVALEELSFKIPGRALSSIQQTKVDAVELEIAKLNNMLSALENKLASVEKEMKMKMKMKTKVASVVCVVCVAVLGCVIIYLR